MTPVHERNLVRRVKRGCEASAREILAAHRGHLHEVAWHYSRVPGYEFEDALQEASAGFIRGVRKFDTSRRTRLLTYAAHWARHHCKRQLENTVGDIRIPVWKQQAMKRADGKFTPFRAARLDAPVDWVEDVTLGDCVAGNDVLPEDGAAENRRQARMKVAYRELIATLTPLERVIAVERLSRPDPDKTTFQAIGNRFSLSRERIRQVEVRLIAKLRKRATDLGGKKLIAA